jgi:hypothetical protein
MKRILWLIAVLAVLALLPASALAGDGIMVAV